MGASQSPPSWPHSVWPASAISNPEAAGAASLAGMDMQHSPPNTRCSTPQHPTGTARAASAITGLQRQEREIVIAKVHRRMEAAADGRTQSTGGAAGPRVRGTLETHMNVRGTASSNAATDQAQAGVGAAATHTTAGASAMIASGNAHSS
ncbi:hypothetical protein GCM10010429_31480 [Micromonospora olivasterospora]